MKRNKAQEIIRVSDTFMLDSSLNNQNRTMRLALSGVLYEVESINLEPTYASAFIAVQLFMYISATSLSFMGLP